MEEKEEEFRDGRKRRKAPSSSLTRASRILTRVQISRDLFRSLATEPLLRGFWVDLGDN